MKPDELHDIRVRSLKAKETRNMTKDYELELQLLNEIERLRHALSRVWSESSHLFVDDNEEREEALVNKVFDIQKIAREALA